MSTEPMHKITVKIGDSLRTVQADTHEEFVEQLELAHESLQACYDLMVAARAVGAVAGSTVEATATAVPASAPAAPSAFTNASIPQCQHGPKTAKTGSTAKGPWKAWMCPAKKGDPTQCSPEWIQRGSAEWNNFPA